MSSFFIDFLIDTVLLNPIVIFFLYLSPLLICFFGYTIQTIKNYRGDRKKRSFTSYSGYKPTDTFGIVFVRLLFSIIPIVNLWMAMFDILPWFFQVVSEGINEASSKPLVPKSDPYNLQKKGGKGGRK